jgi:ligand-binding sensor domain-containing protein
MNFKIIIFLLLSVVLLVSCDKKVSKSPVEPPAQEGKILINSEPPGFTIYLNGKNTGHITPDSLIFLDAGNYQVTLKKNYFNDSTTSVTLSEDEVTNLDFNYFNNPTMYGKMVLFSSPIGASIFINDSLTSLVTPDTILSILPGTYNIKYKKFDYRDIEFNAIVRSSQTLTYSRELQDTSVWVDYQVFNSAIPSNFLSAITIDHNDKKWIGTLQNGLLEFDGSNFSQFDVTNSSLPSNLILGLSVSSTNKISIGTDQGLVIYDNGNWNIYTKQNSGLPHNYIQALEYQGDILWIGTPIGLVKFDGNWETYQPDPAPSRSGITTISIDLANTVWVGVSDTGIGVASFDGTNFNLYSINQYHYPNNNVICSAVSQSGNLWFGFNPYLGIGGGISYFDGNSFNNINLTSQILNNNIFVDDSDIKWISTNSGLYKIIGSSISDHYYMANSPIPSNDIIATVKDSQGNLWIATGTAGLVKFKGANSN